MSMIKMWKKDTECEVRIKAIAAKNMDNKDWKLCSLYTQYLIKNTQKQYNDC